MLNGNSKMVVLIYILVITTVTLSCSYKIIEQDNKDTNEMKNTADTEKEIGVLIKLTEEEESLLAKKENEDENIKLKKTENLLENENDEYDESEINLQKKDAWWFSRRRTTTSYRAATCLGPNRSRCNIGLRYNGCGSQVFKMLSSNILHKQDLEGACNKHDVCYNCGRHKGWSQSQCDQKFYQDAKKLCSCKYKLNIFSLGTCYTAAHIFYVMVLTTGNKYYLSESHQYCFTDHICINDFSPNVDIFKK